MENSGASRTTFRIKWVFDRPRIRNKHTGSEMYFAPTIVYQAVFNMTQGETNSTKS